MIPRQLLRPDRGLKLDCPNSARPNTRTLALIYMIGWRAGRAALTTPPTVPRKQRKPRETVFMEITNR